MVGKWLKALCSITCWDRELWVGSWLTRLLSIFLLQLDVVHWCYYTLSGEGQGGKKWCDYCRRVCLDASDFQCFVCISSIANTELLSGRISCGDGWHPNKKGVRRFCWNLNVACAVGRYYNACVKLRMCRTAVPPFRVLCVGFFAFTSLRGKAQFAFGECLVYIVVWLFCVVWQARKQRREKLWCYYRPNVLHLDQINYAIHVSVPAIVKSICLILPL